MHLLIPLAASIVFVCGLICIKQTSREQMGEHGVGPLTTMFFCNIVAGIAFSSYWVLGGQVPSLGLLWQPLLVALLYLAGLTFTFTAITFGDVSIATPVLGIKVLFVAAVLTVVGGQTPPTTIWISAAMSAAGIALIQWTGGRRAAHAFRTIVIAASASLSFAHFDVLVQRWSPDWGTGRFLPIVFWFVGLLSLVMLPWVQWKPLRRRELRRWLSGGVIFTTLQAMMLVFTLSWFGDAARVNIVYSLRGLWSVGLAYLAARIWGGGEAGLTKAGLATRLTGAALLTAAVILAMTVRR